MRNSPSVPEDLRKKFNSSFSIVEDNTAWYNLHHLEINEWTKKTVLELELDPDDFVHNTTTVLTTSSDADIMSPSIQTSPKSLSASLNSQAFVYILLNILLSLLVIIFNYY